MSVLTASSRANQALVLPAVLAAAFVSQTTPHQIAIEYKDVESVGEGEAEVILTTNEGEAIIGERVVPYLVDHYALAKSVNASQVCQDLLLRFQPATQVY